MKVKELIAELQEQDPEREVILQKDSEGNGYEYLYSIWSGAYRPNEREAGLDELTEEDRENGYCEDDVYDEEGDVKVVILTP